MHHENNIRKLNPQQPDSEIILEAARIIHRGGVVVFPTTGLYGLAADAGNRKAVERVFNVKMRPSTKPLLILIPDRLSLRNVVSHIPEVAERLMDAFWPGGLTLIFHAHSSVLPELTAGTGKIGVRLPAHPVSRLLVEAVGRPITATSANIYSHGGCSCIDHLESAVANAVDMVLDAGLLEGGTGSSVLDVTQTPPVLIREGAVSRIRIAAISDGPVMGIS